MNKIFGIFSRKGNLNYEDLFINTLNSLNNNSRKINTFNDANIFSCAISLTTLTHQSKYDYQPYYSANGSLVIFFDGRIDNRNELTEITGIDKNIDNIPDSLLVLKYFEIKGTECFKYLIGDFAFVIWNKTKKEIICVRDSMGVKPFYYSFSNDLFVFASEIKLLLNSHLVSTEFDDQYIADSLSGLLSEKWRTFYKNIKRLQPAHYLKINNNSSEEIKYWDILSVNNSLVLTEEEIIENMKNIFSEAVRCRLNSIKPLGAELSGGIDSAGIAAYMQTFFTNSSNPFYFFSHIMPDYALEKIQPYNDERENIKLICNHLKINSYKFIDARKKAIIPSLELNLDINAMPTQQHYQAFSDALYECANELNINVLLSGFGGDELVSFFGAGFFNQLFIDKRFDLLFKELQYKYSHSKIKVLKKLLLIFAEIYFRRLYKYYQKYFNQSLHWSIIKYKNASLNPEFEKRLKIHEKVKYYSQNAEPKCFNNRELWHINHHHISQRLEYSQISANHFNIEYRYPMFDRRLIEYVLSVPYYYKVKSGKNRYLYRKTIENLLPPEIVWKEKGQGASIPSVMCRLINDKSKIINFINEAENENIGKEYIDYKKLIDWFQKIIKNNDNSVLYPSLFINYIEFLLFLKKCH
jgi:asparagine synthase (glutamine-hydrolysing)